MRIAIGLRLFALFAVALPLVSQRAAAADTPPQRLEVVRTADLTKAIPISLSGYTGETLAVLQFDLTVQGFRIETAEGAALRLTGKNDSRVEGVLTDKSKTQPLLARGYSGVPLRTQAHAMADDVVQAVSGKPGIGQTRIAFKVETASGSEIYISEFDGFNAVALTRDGTVVAAPCWAHANRALYYTSYKLGDPYIFSHDLTTGGREAVCRYPGMNSSAAVSRDGRHMSMILSKSGRTEVYVADSDGKNPRQLSQSRTGASSPCWSPDGRTVCYSSSDSGSSALYLIPATGGTPQRLRTAGVLNATEPDWSPDGTKIIFTTQRGANTFELCVVPAGGGEVERLGLGEDPSWAPNSRTVVFTRRVSGRRTLSLLDVPTKQVKDIPRILGNSGNNSQPSWAK